MEESTAAWAHIGLDLKEEADDVAKFCGVALRDLGVVSLDDFLVEAFHVFCTEGTGLEIFINGRVTV